MTDFNVVVPSTSSSLTPPNGQPFRDSNEPTVVSASQRESSPRRMQIKLIPTADLNSNAAQLSRALDGVIFSGAALRQTLNGSTTTAERINMATQSRRSSANTVPVVSNSSDAPSSESLLVKATAIQALESDSIQTLSNDSAGAGLRGAIAPFVEQRPSSNVPEINSPGTEKKFFPVLRL